MFLSAVSVLVVVQSSSEIPEGLMNNPVECEGINWIYLAQDEDSSRLSGTNDKTTDSINGMIFLEYPRAYCLLRKEPNAWEYHFILDIRLPVKM